MGFKIFDMYQKGKSPKLVHKVILTFIILCNTNFIILGYYLT